MIGLNEGIKYEISDGKVISTVLGDVYLIKLGIHVGTMLVSLDGSLDGYNYVKIEGLFLGDSL